jgi:AbrB family looped-hinge helix DNA binding protein
MSKTHSEKIREALQNLGIASPREIMDWIKAHYPEDPVKPTSYRAEIIGCSINHSSSHHYPGMPKFVWFIKETKKYRLATDEDKENLNSNAPKPATPRESSEIIDGIYISELSPTSKLHIPMKIRAKLNIQPGDKIGFIIKEDGSIVLKKAKLKLTFE